MKLILVSRLAGAIALPAAAMAQPLDASWSTIDCGGGLSAGGGAEIFGVIGQPDAADSSAAGLECRGGFLGVAPPVCYANCDGSSVAPILNANDFGCFLNKFAAQDSYANCDASTTPPVLNALDFGCFLSKFAAGCP